MPKFLKALVEKREGKMLAIATDETVDRHGESLPIDSWDLKNFKKNPVLQFAHDYSTPPVGRAKNISIKGKEMTFEPDFHDITEMAREVKKMYEEGIMKAFSVGYIPHNDAKESEPPKLRLELLEISAVPIPANPAAIVTEKALKQKVSKKEFDEISDWVNKEMEEKSLGDTEKLVREEEKEKEDNMAKIKEQLEQKQNKNNELLCDEKDEEVKNDKPNKTDSLESVAGEKSGKVISKKTKSIIQNAVDALNELLKMDEKEEIEEEEDDDKKTIEKINKKGRSQESILLEKILENINNQVGYLCRKAKKERK